MSAMSLHWQPIHPFRGADPIGQFQESQGDNQQFQQFEGFLHNKFDKMKWAGSYDLEPGLCRGIFSRNAGNRLA